MLTQKKEVTAKVPSYEQFLAFYKEMQDIEDFYTLAEIQQTISYLYLSFVTHELGIFPDLKVKVMAEKLRFMLTFFEQIDRLKPE